MRTQIAVGDVRKISAFMSLTPAEGGWRVAIVDGAEEMNVLRQALLKILEEPPRQALLILTCSAPGRLLPTIRSRCRKLRLDPLPAEAMERLLAMYLPELPADERGRLVTVAEGSPGRALLLAQEDGLKVARLVDEVLAELPGLKPARAYVVADALARGETAFSNFFDLLRADIAAAVRDVVRGQGDEEQSRLVALRPLDAWGDVWHALTRLQDETERFNLDKRQAWRRRAWNAWRQCILIPPHGWQQREKIGLRPALCNETALLRHDPDLLCERRAHIGHAYTSIAADVMARWKRLDGYDVFFLTGTDEHGQKVESAARNAGMDPQSFTDKVSADFRDMSDQMGVLVRRLDPHDRGKAQGLVRRALAADRRQWSHLPGAL